MTDICCPICGCKKIEVFPQSTTPHFKNSTSAFAKPSIKNLMQHVVSYAAMGVSSARLIKGATTRYRFSRGLCSLLYQLCTRASFWANR